MPAGETEDVRPLRAFSIFVIHVPNKQALLHKRRMVEVGTKLPSAVLKQQKEDSDQEPENDDTDEAEQKVSGIMICKEGRENH